SEVRRQRTEDKGHVRKLGFYWLSIFLFALGLMSKPMVVTLPCVLLLLDFWPLQRFQISDFRFQISNPVRLVLQKVPFFVLSFAASVLTFLAQRAGGAVSNTTVIPVSLRISNAVMAYLQYFVKTIWPLNLSPFYPYQSHWPLALVGTGAVLLAGVTLAF